MMASVLPDLSLFTSVLKSIAVSSSSVHTHLQSSESSPPSYNNGISLLSLKNSVLLTYMHDLTLLALCRLHGRSLQGIEENGAEGTAGSDIRKILVEDLVRNRVVLEKIKPMEAKLRYQIDKLVKKAEDAERLEKESKTRGRTALELSDAAIGNDPLNFKPNPGALMSDSGGSDSEDDKISGAAVTNNPHDTANGVYRPPRLAPVVYNEVTRGKKVRPPPAGNGLLRDLATSLTSSSYNPYVESTSGLSITPSLQSRKAKKLEEIQRYEEDNMTRLFMTKKDSKRRRLDEEDIALGGTGSREDFMKGARAIRGRRGPGFENEFDDLLGSIAKKKKTGQADGYDALRAMRRERRPASTSAGVDAETINVNGISTVEQDSGKSGKERKGRSKFDTALKRNSQSRARSKGKSIQGQSRRENAPRFGNEH